METPLITIVTITFNAEKVLERTMRSVADQTFRNFEHLIIDGASHDRTIEIARQSRAARILSEPDKGLYDAMNKGIRLACGKYLLFLNAGDTFRCKDSLALFAKEAEKGVDIVYADTMIVDEKGEDIGPRHHTAPELLTFESFSKGMLVCHQAFMVKRELAPEYDLQYRFSADYDWTIRCLSNSRPENCVNLHSYAINYLSDGLTDKNKLKSLKERYRIMSRYYGSLPTFMHHVKLVLGINFH